MAQVLVQNRVDLRRAAAAAGGAADRASAIKKQSPNILLVVNLYSARTAAGDQLYLSQLRDDPGQATSWPRSTGVGDVIVFGQRLQHAGVARPGQAGGATLTASDVINAIREQNVQVAAGQLGQEPAPPGQAFQYTLRRSAGWTTSSSSRTSSSRWPTAAGTAGTAVRIAAMRAAATGAATPPVVELGGPRRADDRSRITLLDGSRRSAWPSSSCPGPTRWTRPTASRRKMEELKKRFPPGRRLWPIVYDTTPFIRAVGRRGVQHAASTRSSWWPSSCCCSCRTGGR